MTTALDLTTDAIRTRALSADTTASVETLHFEAVKLREIIDAHAAAQSALWELRDNAREAGQPELAELITRQLDALGDDGRCYWAAARMTDIQLRLGAGYSRQVTMGFSQGAAA
jgi:hypothetical protein